MILIMLLLLTIGMVEAKKENSIGNNVLSVRRDEFTPSDSVAFIVEGDSVTLTRIVVMHYTPTCLIAIDSTVIYDNRSGVLLLHGQTRFVSNSYAPRWSQVWIQARVYYTVVSQRNPYVVKQRVNYITAYMIFFGRSK